MIVEYVVAYSPEGWRGCRLVRIDGEGDDRTAETVLEHVGHDEGTAIARALQAAYDLGRRHARSESAS